MRRLMPAAMILALSVTGYSYAQKDFSFGTNLLVDNNIFRNYAQQGDVVFMPYADLGYQLTLNDMDNLFFGYGGNFYLFNQLSYRDFSVHRFGVDYNHLWPESRSLIAAGGKVEVRINPSDYSYYNYTSGGFYLNYKTYLRENMMFLVRYNLNGRDFSEFPEFNYSEHIFQLQTNFYLPTRTTLALSSTYYYKNYTTGIQTLDSVFVAPFNSPTGELPAMSMGHGFGRGRAFLLHPDRFGEGFYRYGIREDQFPSTDQLKLGLTVGQNLAEGTGLMLAYFTRINPHNRNRFLSNLGESVLNNEELFDDHYSYIGHEGKVQLTQMLPGQSRLILLFSARQRKFSGRAAMDLEGNLLPGEESRLDRALFFEAEFRKNLALPGSPLLRDLDFTIQFGAGRNRSNDQYYNYKNAYFLMTVGKSF